VKYLFTALVICGCVTVPVHEPWPTSDEMEAGTIACTQLCIQYGRNIQEYRSDGKCVCRSYKIHEVLPKQKVGAHVYDSDL
jgi:hypothetical protein